MTNHQTKNDARAFTVSAADRWLRPAAGTGAG